MATKVNKKMSQAILLVRVSTTTQEIETQKQELIDYAVADGYSKKDLIIIAGEGASAIKLNDLYLREVQELYDTIEDNKNITAVYAWEISRIGRNEVILMQIKNFLIEHKTQLVIKHPSLRLLNNDGSVNTGVELAFSLFATMSKQEMIIKKERFARAKERNRKEQRFNGGHVKFGYRLDKEKHYEPDPVDAEHVREMYRLYTEEDWTSAAISRHFISLGVLNPQRNKQQETVRMVKILKDVSYLGQKGFPQIISQDLFDKAAAKIASHRWRHDPTHVYFAKGILRDKLDGTVLAGSINNCVYNHRYTDNNYTLNLNAVDFAIWFSACFLYNSHISTEAKVNVVEYKKLIDDNEIKIANLQGQLVENGKQIDRAMDLNIMRPEHFTTEKLNATINRIEKENKRIEKEIAELQTDNTRYRQFLDGEQKPKYINLTDELTDTYKKEVIDSVLESFTVTKVEKGKFIFHAVNKIGYIDGSYWIYQVSGSRYHLYFVDARGASIELTKEAKKMVRFERKRYDRKKK